jgi:hypothetical protein
MDHSSYPFNKNAKPRRTIDNQNNEPFAVSKFPINGASQPLKALSLSIADKKFAEAW